MQCSEGLQNHNMFTTNQVQALSDKSNFTN